jgi:DNA polymerase elongation subunit (family B)
MYQSIGYDRKSSTMHIWDDELGYQKFTFKPYAYLPAENGKHVSLDGTRLERVEGNHKDNPKSYESDLNEEVRTLIDLYYDSDLVSKGHRDFFFDIETAKDENGYSTIQDTRTAITSIAYYDKTGNDRRVLILDEQNRIKEREIQGDGYTLEIFRDERDLLTRFINKFAEIQPTVITGWNTDGYDIPYLLGRTKKVLGAQAIRKLSPAGIVDFNPKKDKWKIFGVSSLDYLKLYKNFTYTELPNYRLDTVAKKELGKGKVEYDGDLDTLFTQDIHKFAFYNMTDTDLVYELDEKLQLINLARTICHKGHVPYEDVYYASKYLDGAAIVDLKRNGLVAPNKQFRFIEEETAADALAGAYVMPPVPGLYKWIYDLDLTSLYPSIIMTLNISPETKVGVIYNWDEMCLLKTEPVSVQFGRTTITDVKQWLADNKYTIASNGTVYRTDIKGFLPTILEKWFDERVEFKDKRDEYAVGTEEYKFYDAMQLTQKVLLNSFYGVLGLKTFRFHDLDNAGAITATGQSIIKFSAKVINNHYQQEIGNDHFINATGAQAEFAFYTDTDSTFVSSLPLIEKRYPGFDETDEQFMIDKTNEIADEVQSKVNTMYNQYARVFLNAYTHRFKIKQEYVAKSGLWIAKKRYAQWVIFKEGKPTDKMDIKGLDVVRSSFPDAFKTVMKETLWYLLKGKSKQETSTMILDFKKKIQNTTTPVLDVMKNSGVKEISKYVKRRKPFSGYMSGTPAHVKSAINFNDVLTQLNTDIVTIKDGEKVKWAYLQGNPYGFDTIALRGYQDPPEIVDFVEKYIDRNKQFERELKGKLDDFYAAMNWGGLPENNNAAKFFSFGK